MNTETRKIMRIPVLLVSYVLISAPMNTQAMDPSDREIGNMERHWNNVISETDHARRQALIEEHRGMMADYASIQIPGHDGPMDDMHSHSREMHIKNMVDMHTNMMDMIQ